MTFNEPEERLHAPQVQLPYQLPDDVVDGEDREVALESLPPPERGVLQSKGLDVPVELLDLPHHTGSIQKDESDREDVSSVAFESKESHDPSTVIVGY